MNFSSSPGAAGATNLTVLWEDGDRVFCRGVSYADGRQAAVLTVLPAAEHPTAATLDRLAHEYALKDVLDGAWAVRPLELVRERGQIVLLLEDTKSEPMDRLFGGAMEVGGFLRLAIAVAAALTQVHRRGLVHKDIKPTNILVNRTTGEVKLTGFGIASRLPRERQTPAPPESIAGTLAYMAPEQTGRMNRSIDARSDLYALGVTFYQMLTGSLPFTAADPMEWVHCHIARKPVPPSERLTTIPTAVSALIVKLLAKTAEDRYQTAAGVERDLRRCLAAWEAGHRIDAFPLGQQDAADRLSIPEKLYGREREIDTLLAAFDRVVTSGRPELVLVSGYSGIGKSAVVNELHKALVPPRGLFAAGKFDQYKRDIPYATLAQAFQSLIRSLLGKGDAELAGWRNALREALGPNGRLMIDVVPELKLLIGEQAPVPELPPQQAQGHLQLVFRRFLGVFARPEHPLVLFLDDLQWLDAATLDMLADLLTQSDVQQLLVIGAYRDNEVDPAHPLMRRLDAIRKSGALVQEISLAPLAREDLGRLIAETLSCTPRRAAPLARLLHDKTGGNPFFAIQFISALAEEELLRFDHDTARWRWEPHRIHAKGYTDNVVDLMVGKLTRLPVETQAALQQLACLGNVADIDLLSIVLGKPDDDVRSDIWNAVRLELVEHFEDSYKFIHDRVQEAAYSLIPEGLRAEAHLRIGRLLAAHTPAEKREEAIFEIVNQLNRGAGLITSRDEREQLAEFNLLAGRRAKATTAYASALTYLAAGTALLPEDAWQRRHALTFALELHRGECEFLTVALAEAEQRLASLSTRAANTVERATVACLRIDLYTALDQSSRAIAVALDYLRHLGIDWSPHPTEEEARREYERVWSQLGGRTIESLIELPLMSDPASLATLDVLTKIGAPAVYTDANLVALVACRAVNLSLERGNCDASCSAYVWLSMVAGPIFGDYRTVVYRFGQLGYDLVDGRGLTRFQARVYMEFAYAVLPWTRHVRVSRDLLRRAFEAANKIGDLTYAAYCGDQLNTNLLAAGDPLAEVEREADRGLAFAQKMRFGLVTDLIAPQLGLIRTLRGVTPTFGCFDDAQFDEARIERHFSGNPDLAFAECWYWIRKLQVLFFAADYAGALYASSRAQRVLWTSVSQLETAEYHFYAALSHAAFCDSAAAGERQQHLEAVAAHHEKLYVWAGNCPDNFENRAALVGAEIARIEGRELDAERLYEQAIRSACDQGFVQNEGLAYEVAARFYSTRGFETIANAYLRNARHCYLRWGADGKVRQLDRLHPHLGVAEWSRPAAFAGSPVQQLDVATVVKASQVVSSEIVLSKLIERLMTIALENAGADRGLLILPAEDDYLIQAEAKATADQVEVGQGQRSITRITCPETIVRYVIRTQESVILDDASRPNLFSEDDYLRSGQAKSILCLPLIKQGRLTGLLYLENTLTSHAFAADRIAILELLAAQAAISLENTRLYGDLQEREAKVRRLIDSNIIGIFIWNFEGRIIEANEAFLHMVGHSRDDLVSGRVRWTALTPADWHDTSERAVAELRATGTTKTYEKEFFRKDGTRLPILIGSATFGAARDEGVAFVLDLTERKQAEASLEEILTFERLLADLSARFADNSIVQVETEIDSALTLLQEFLGFDRSNFFEFTADGRATIIGSVARAGVQRHPLGPAPAFLSWYLGQVRAGKVMRVQSIGDLPPEAVEQIAYHRQVGIRSSLGLPLRVAGRIVGVITFAAFGSTRKWSDDLIARLKVIGEVMAQTLMRKRAEDALRESEQQFRDFAGAASDWYWETGPDHRFITHLVSEQQLNTIGVLTTSRIGAVRWDFAHDLEEEPEKWRQHVADLDAHKPFRDFRYRAASRDGSEVYIAASGKPIFDPKGNFLGYRGVASHISAAVRAALLEEALQEAKVVGDNIAHDLRTPLTRVRLRLERGREHASTLEEMRAVADQAITGLDQSLTTITALLRITEIEHSRRREAFSEVQLAPLLREVGDLYEPMAEDKGIVLRVEIPTGAMVQGDRDLLFEAVTNLVDNAVKFTPEGGRVELALLHQEGETVIRVSDTGPGIPELEREAVTQRFYRSDKNRNTKGLGLGLSMVAAIVKLHNFRFTIAPGPGCTVEIACPRKN